QRVGGFERRGDELVERNALRRAQPHVALDLTHRPDAQHGGQLVARAAPAGRGLAHSALSGGGLARGGIGAPAVAAGRIILSPLAPLLLRLAPARRSRRRCRQVAVEARLLLVVERAVERLQS